jgi:hypothetical protein
MSTKKWAIILFLWIGLPVLADDVELRPDHPNSYTVQPGDTLWDISGKFLTRPWLWPEIWHVNPQVQNPHLIYPGDVLTLAWCDGRPCLQVASGRYVRLSPTIREYPHDDAIPPIPLDAIQQFLSRPLVVSDETLKQAPYILSSEDQHLVAGAGHKIYVRGSVDANVARYGIYRGGEVYVDPDTEEVLGYEALYVGDALLQRLGDPATALVTKSNREVLVGDRLLPEGDEIDPTFYPHPPANQFRGKIISVLDGVSQVGQYQIVVLNRGHGDGVDPGTVLAIHQAGIFVRDTVAAEQERGPGSGATGELVELPEERIGEAMVFRTFDRVSYALVMNTQKPAHVRDVVTNP